MSARFLSGTPLSQIEFEMQIVPGFLPRKSGFAVRRYAYTPADCECRYCTERAERKKTACPGCHYFLDRIQVQMATAREFLIVIRLRDEKESEVFPYLSRIEKSLKEQGFSVKRADNEDIKRLLAVYFEQNVTTEKFEDFDGERWIIPDD